MSAAGQRGRRPDHRSLLRVAFVVVVLAVCAAVVVHVVDGLDARKVAAAFGDLSPVGVASIVVSTVALLVAEAALAAAFVPGLSLRRGAIAFFVTTSASSLLPGPADYPVRYKMLRSWGYDAQVAATASAGPTVFNSAHKLVMPLVAATAIALGDVHIGGIRRLVVVGSLVFTIAVLAVVAALGTEDRTRSVARAAERAVRRPVAEWIIGHRNRAALLVRQTWKRAIVGLTLVVAASVALFVACLRATGTPGDALPVLALVAVWAMVRAISALPTTPGDVGLSDAAYLSLLTQIAGTAHVNTIAAGVVVYRAITLLLPLPLGVLALAAWRRSIGTAADDLEPR